MQVHNVHSEFRIEHISCNRNLKGATPPLKEFHHLALSNHCKCENNIIGTERENGEGKNWNIL